MRAGSLKLLRYSLTKKNNEKQATTECIYKPLIGKLLLNKASSTLSALYNAKNEQRVYPHSQRYTYSKQKVADKYMH